MTPYQRSGPVAMAQSSIFPFFKLPGELRNMIYRFACCPDAFVTSLSPPSIPLLHTNKQIRDEALDIYYAKSRFHLTLDASAGQVLHKIQKFVDGKQNPIQTCVRDINFTLDQRPGGVRGDPEYSLGHLPFRFLRTEGDRSNPRSRWTDHLSARKEFIARARRLGDGPKFEEALELFDAVWMLADTFPMARKCIFANSYLPVRFTYTIWQRTP